MKTQRPALHARWAGIRTIAPDAPGAAARSLTSILDAVETPIVVLGRDLTVSCFNHAAADRMRLSAADTGRPVGTLPALAGQPRLEAQCAQVMATGVERGVDLQDGARWFVVRISALPGGEGATPGVVLSFTNVTAFRASVEQAVYERESTKAILNTVTDPLIVLSSDEGIQSANRAFYEKFGVSRDGTLGVPLHALGNGAFGLAPLRAGLQGLLAGGHSFQPVEVEHVVTREGERTLLLDARPLALPGRPEHRVLVTFQDITARKRAEAAKDRRSEADLRRSEAFLAEAQRLNATGSFSWRVERDEIEWSEQLYRIFEFDPGTVVTLDRIGARVHPEDVPRFTAMVERARSTHEDFDAEYRLQMPDRSVKYLHVIAHAARDRNGRWEYIGAAQDVTQRRVSEEALAVARSELAHVSRVSTLGALTASIAHEVNQPLSGIITNASTCLRMLAADPPNVEGARETARRTIRDGERAADVIARLRGLFTKRTLASDRVDLNEAAREVVALTSSELQRGKVTVRLSLANDLPPVRGDRVQLQQVMLNLVLNALDAMRAVEGRPRELELRTEPEADGGVRLSVQDSGGGLDAESIARLFDAFYSTKHGGMGIGLSVSRSIVESHHGRLWATQNAGAGATFAFSIPTGSRGPTSALGGPTPSAARRIDTKVSSRATTH